MDNNNNKEEKNSGCLKAATIYSLIAAAICAGAYFLMKYLGMS